MSKLVAISIALLAAACSGGANFVGASDDVLVSRRVRKCERSWR